MELKGILTLGDLARFQYFHTFRRMWWLALFVLFFLAVGWPVLSWDAAHIAGMQDMARNITPFFLLGTIWCVLMAVMPYWNARRQYQAQSEFSEPFTFGFTPQGLSYRGASGSWDCEWRLIRSVRETRSAFVLYRGPASAQVVPKRFFCDAAQQEQWRRLVEAAIAPRRIERPGPAGRWC